MMAKRELIMTFEWYKPKAGILMVSIANYGMTFYGDAIEAMGSPAYITMGYDEVNQVIGVKAIDKTPDLENDKKIKFAEKKKNSYIRICDRNFIRFIASKTEHKINIGNKPKKFLAEWYEENGILYIYLEKYLE
jgi:hypothetical protein